MTPPLRFEVTARVPIRRMPFQVSVFVDGDSELQHLALVLGDVTDASPGPVLLRVHSECMTGDIFGSARCDCGAQLNEALDLIAERKRGLVVYLRQEGRGIGLVGKLEAYNLQDQLGLDTVDANLRLGYPVDQRTFGTAAEILHLLGVGPVELITNSPKKIAELRAHGVDIVSTLRSSPSVNEHNRDYLRAKRDRLGHLIEGIPPEPAGTS